VGPRGGFRALPAGLGLRPASTAVPRRPLGTAIAGDPVDDRLRGSVAHRRLTTGSGCIRLIVVIIGSTTPPTATAVDLCTVLGE
jgi:hypothetical protein